MYLFVSPHDLSYAVFGLVEGEVKGSVGALGDLRNVETRPEGILKALLDYLKGHRLEPRDLEGVVIVTGPGSSTALRAGVSIVNTLAFVHALPLLLIQNPDGKPLLDLLRGASLLETMDFAVPEYGRGPRITLPKPEKGCG